tara:strand:+ start:89525 stop:90262 length:738 start_codon:yes stop_codon:yes gene_type:complete
MHPHDRGTNTLARDYGITTTFRWIKTAYNEPLRQLMKKLEETNSMKTLRITSAALAIALGMGISSTSQAFMASPAQTQAINAEQELTTTLDALREEIVIGETAIDVMVAKLDAFVKNIDDMLDEGVQNEDLFLAAREEAITLRQSLPGLDKYLAGLEANGPVGESIISDTLLSEQPLGDVGGGFSGGGGSVRTLSGGGGGGSRGGLLGGRSGLGLLGTVGAAVAIPLTVSDDDSPGPVASQSMTN